ncbi:lysosome-associated membrane glycoprotein 1-like [Homalodisca vitripennis]|uniref:lysosome-associated membrane glycoprotein 1-like n=1 Tax=Homalodisca vitripennis TaxID=197043 RepID=UPI001EEAED68|nr:lysosome-associated membrane glycoprotein 1-like [Homalodisca vitripennis]
MIFKAHTFVLLLFAITVTLADNAEKPSVDATGLNGLPDEPDKNVTTKSPTTTTVAPSSSTTTPAPSPTTTTTPAPSPTTTTTPAPSPTTTTPATTTSTTTQPSTTTPPTTTSAPTPPTQDWIVRDINDTVCIMANMKVKVTVPYNATGGKMVNAEMLVNSVSEAAAATGGCLPGDVQVLTLMQKNVNYTFTFVRNSTAKTYALGNVTITVLVNNATFPNSTMTVPSISLFHASPVFSLPLNNSYTCYEVDALPFNGTAGNTTVKATVELKQIQVEAFGTGKKPNYYAPLDCTSGDTPDIVPIAVGLILAGLVVVVLIAYLVGRRRAQARGYLSM